MSIGLILCKTNNKIVAEDTLRDTARVRNTLVHVLGQIAYKKGCIEIVVAHLKKWKNKRLAEDALKEIIDVHKRYKSFSALAQKEAEHYIAQHYI